MSATCLINCEISRLKSRLTISHNSLCHPAMSPEQPNNLRAPLPTGFTTAHRRLIQIAGYFVVLVRDMSPRDVRAGGARGASATSSAGAAGARRARPRSAAATRGAGTRRSTSSPAGTGGSRTPAAPARPKSSPPALERPRGPESPARRSRPSRPSGSPRCVAMASRGPGRRFPRPNAFRSGPGPGRAPARAAWGAQTSAARHC